MAWTILYFYHSFNPTLPWGKDIDTSEVSG
jgi:hypothetical protein